MKVQAYHQPVELELILDVHDTEVGPSFVAVTRDRVPRPGGIIAYLTPNGIRRAKGVSPELGLPLDEEARVKLDE